MLCLADGLASAIGGGMKGFFHLAAFRIRLILLVGARGFEPPTTCTPYR